MCFPEGVFSAQKGEGKKEKGTRGGASRGEKGEGESEFDGEFEGEAVVVVEVGIVVGAP